MAVISPWAVPYMDKSPSTISLSENSSPFGPTVMPVLLNLCILQKLNCLNAQSLQQKVFPWTATLAKVALPFVIELHVKMESVNTTLPKALIVV